MLLKNANIYDVRKGTFKLGHLLIEHGRITDIGLDAPVQSAAVDMEASYVLPGFIDAHVHLCVDTYNPDHSRLWAGAKPGAIALSAARAAYRTLLCGVTTIREVGGWDYHEIAVRDAVNRVHAALYDPRGGMIAQCQFGAAARPENVVAVYQTWDELTAEGAKAVE